MKKTVSILIITLLITSGFVLFINIEPKIIAAGKTLYVGGSGPGNWSNIYEALENASNGDTIFVYKGCYWMDKNLYINKKIKLIGEDREGTTLDGGDPMDEYYPDEIIYISVDDVTVTGFNITRISVNPLLQYWTGIRIHSGSNCLIYNNKISESNYGIEIFSNYNKIYHNIILNNFWIGAEVIGSNNLIYHNTFINNGYELNDCQASDDGSSNSWDNGYPSGGNYYSDYSPTAQDLYNGSTTPQTSGSPDGICDSPYTISGTGNNKDYYPLKYKNVTGSKPKAPTGLMSTKTGIGWVNFTWNQMSQARDYPVTGYKIYRGLKLDKLSAIAEIGKLNFYNDTDITNGITYYYKVSAINALGEGPLSDELTVILYAEPTPPINLNLTVGNSYVKIQWDPPDSDGGKPVTNYKIYRGEVTEQNELLNEIGNITDYNDTTVTNGITYFYRVRAVNEIGDGLFSQEVNATPWDVPTEPVEVEAEAGDSYVYLKWSQPTDDGGFSISNYLIYKGETSNSEIFLTEVENELFFNDTDVVNGKTYYYKISAKNIKGEGTKSLEVSATPGTVPSSPGDFNFIAGDSFVFLDWNVPEHDGGFEIFNYNIYRGEISGDLDYLSYTEEDELFYNDTSVTNDESYYYEVTAVNQKGESPPTPEIRATPYFTSSNGHDDNETNNENDDNESIPDDDNNQELSVPSQPRNLEVFPSNGSITLTWDPPFNIGGSEILKYYVYRYNTNSSDTNRIKLGNITRFIDSGLTNGERYYYRVSAVNIVGEGLKSKEVSAIPNSNPTAPSFPEDLSAVVDNNTITLNWHPPLMDGSSPITTYILFRRTETTDKYFVFNIGNVLTYTDTELQKGITYYYRISAVNSIGEGPRSNEIHVILGSTPSPPVDLNIEKDGSYLNISWSSPESDGGVEFKGYFIYKGTSPENLSFYTVVQDQNYFVDTDVTPGVAYYYKISAANIIGEGLLSDEVSATPGSSTSQPQNTFLDQSWWIWVVISIVIIILLVLFILVKKKILPPRRFNRHRKDDDDIPVY
jgi:parallel beta-helix repeat protein